MKIFGIIVGVIGAAIFVWHLVKVFLDAEQQTGILSHHWLSLIGGILMLAGIGIYIAGRRGQINRSTPKGGAEDH